MKKERRAETDIARVVVTELQQWGYETYEEVQVGYGGNRADIVGVSGPVLVVVECKANLSLALLDQMAQWRGKAHRVIGAIGSGRIGWAVERFCKAEGFGLWSAGFEEVHEAVAPRLNRRAAVTSLRRALAPEQRSGEYARAGSQGGHYTPFARTCRRLRDLVTKQPGIELRVALKEIEHHYMTHKTAMSSLPSLIRKGVVEGVRLDDGSPLRLFVAEMEQPASINAVDPVDRLVAPGATRDV